MQIALASFENLFDWEKDDRPLEAALTQLGVQITKPAWDDPGISWERFDACLIRTTWDYHERHQEFLSWAGGPHRRFFNPADVIRWNIDKRYIRQLMERGVPCVPTVWLEPGSSPRDALERLDPSWTRAFLKPIVGANAHLTLRFDPTDPQQLQAAEDHARVLCDGVGGLLQPYLATVETEGEVSGIFVDGVFCHGVRKVPVPGDYRVQDDHGATDAPWHPSPAERDTLTSAVAHAADILGSEVLGGLPLLYARADFLWGLDGQLLLTELELIEPSLFFRHGAATANALAEALVSRCT